MSNVIHISTDEFFDLFIGLLTAIKADFTADQIAKFSGDVSMALSVLNGAKQYADRMKALASPYVN